MRKLLLLLLVSGVMMFGCKDEFAPQGEDIPSLNVLMMDSSTVINTKHSPVGEAVVMLYFSPDCEHCQEETVDLIKNMEKLRGIRFYYISPMSMWKMKMFYEYYKLDRYKNIIMVSDYKNEFYNHFRPEQIPFQVVYDKNGKLIRKYNSASSANSILRTINKS